MFQCCRSRQLVLTASLFYYYYVDYFIACPYRGWSIQHSLVQLTGEDGNCFGTLLLTLWNWNPMSVSSTKKQNWPHCIVPLFEPFKPTPCSKFLHKWWFFPSLDSVNSTCVACWADCHSCTPLADCIICDDGYEIFKRECHLKCSDRYGVLTSVCLTAQFGMIINLCTLHKINYVVEIIEIFCSSFCWLVVHRSLKSKDML